MLESLKITRQLSEQRVKALGLRKAAAGLESESSTEEERATANEAFSSAVEEQIALEGKYRAALDVESAAAEAAALVHPGNGGGFSPEQREFVEIEGRASFAKYLDGQFSRAGKVDGPEAELRSAVGDACGNFSGLDNVVPWSMILTPDELRDIRNTQQERAVVGSPGNIGAMQDPIIKAIFAGSTAAFLGTNFTSAQVGQQLEYVLTPTSATLKARDGGQDAGGSLTSTLMQPRRLTSAYEMQVEQMAEVRGLEAALRADLPRGQSSALDKAVINGGAAPEFPKGILNSLTAVDMTVLATFDSSIAGHLESYRWAVRLDTQASQDRGQSGCAAVHVRPYKDPDSRHACRLFDDADGRDHVHVEHAHPCQGLPDDLVQDRSGTRRQCGRKNLGRWDPDHQRRDHPGGQGSGHHHGAELV